VILFVFPAQEVQEKPDVKPMPGKRSFGVLLSLREHLQRQKRQQLEESSRQMIEAEQALFVAIRLAQREHAEPSAHQSENDDVSVRAALKASIEASTQASIQPPPKTSSSRKKTAA
jgi:hypothetical protein